MALASGHRRIPRSECLERHIRIMEYMWIYIWQEKGSSWLADRRWRVHHKICSFQNNAMQIRLLMTCTVHLYKKMYVLSWDTPFSELRHYKTEHLGKLIFCGTPSTAALIMTFSTLNVLFFLLICINGKVVTSLRSLSLSLSLSLCVFPFSCFWMNRFMCLSVHFCQHIKPTYLMWDLYLKWPVMKKIHSSS